MKQKKWLARYEAVIRSFLVSSATSLECQRWLLPKLFAWERLKISKLPEPAADLINISSQYVGWFQPCDLEIGWIYDKGQKLGVVESEISGHDNSQFDYKHIVIDPADKTSYHYDNNILLSCRARLIWLRPAGLVLNKQTIATIKPV